MFSNVLIIDRFAGNPQINYKRTKIMPDIYFLCLFIFIIHSQPFHPERLAISIKIERLTKPFLCCLWLRDCLLPTPGELFKRPHEFSNIYGNPVAASGRRNSTRTFCPSPKKYASLISCLNRPKSMSNIYRGMNYRTKVIVISIRN